MEKIETPPQITLQDAMNTDDGFDWHAAMNAIAHRVGIDLSQYINQELAQIEKSVFGNSLDRDALLAERDALIEKSNAGTLTKKETARLAAVEEALK